MDGREGKGGIKLLVAMICMIGIGSVYLLVFILYENIKTIQLLKKHQDEWDKIKSGLNESEVFDAHLEYCKYLMMNRHPIVGACFSRM